MENFDELRRLAEAGDPVSQNRLGMMYARGQTGMQDYSEASKWLAKSAGQGNNSAQNNLNYGYSGYNPYGSQNNNNYATVQRGY